MFFYLQLWWCMCDKKVYQSKMIEGATTKSISLTKRTIEIKICQPAVLAKLKESVVSDRNPICFITSTGWKKLNAEIPILLGLKHRIYPCPFLHVIFWYSPTRHLSMSFRLSVSASLSQTATSSATTVTVTVAFTPQPSEPVCKIIVRHATVEGAGAPSGLAAIVNWAGTCGCKGGAFVL